MTVRLTVVIPTHNRPEGLSRAVTSLQHQTCPEYEAIIVDDGSNPPARCPDDPRFRVISNERTRGSSGARNTGILASSAPIVAFLDDDDEWKPTYIERTLAAHERFGVEFSWCGFVKVLNGQECDPHLWLPNEGNKHQAYLTFLHHRLVGLNYGVAIKRATLEHVGLFDETLNQGADGELLARLFRTARFTAIDEHLVRYHVDHGPDRLSGRDSSNRYRAHLAIIDRHQDTLAEHPQIAAKVLANLAAQYYLRGEKSEARRALRKAFRSQLICGRAWKVGLWYELGLN